MSDLISICIPTYRRPTQLFYAVHSCLAQTYRPLEIDIGDDSPTGDSAALISALVVPADVNIRYRHNVPALGQNKNVDRLIQSARGKRLILLHDDDALLPGSIALMNDIFVKNADVVAAYGKQEMIHENGESFPAHRTDEHNQLFKRIGAESGQRYDSVVCAIWRQFPNNGFLVDTQAAQSTGYRSIEDVGAACDTDFGIRLALHTRGKSFYLIDSVLSQYRMNDRAEHTSSRDIFLRIFQYLRGMRSELTTNEVVALDEYLSDIASRAMVESAIRGDQREALAILFSRYYPWTRRYSLATVLYHMGVVIFPRLEKLRRPQRQLR